MAKGNGKPKPASILRKPYQGAGLTVDAMQERGLGELQRQADISAARARGTPRAPQRVL